MHEHDAILLKLLETHRHDNLEYLAGLAGLTVVETSLALQRLVKAGHITKTENQYPFTQGDN